MSFNPLKIGGSRILEFTPEVENKLGPLSPLVGRWTNVPVPSDAVAAGWTVISVPNTGGQNTGFIYEVTPYTEILEFKPAIVQANNKGPFEEQQTIYGLVYNQHIKSEDKRTADQGNNFPYGTEIHVETGLILYTTNINGGYEIARLATIPHGNVLLALGNSSVSEEENLSFIPPTSTLPTKLDGSDVGVLGYSDKIVGPRQFPAFDQINPNEFLKRTLEAILADGYEFKSVQTIDLTTHAENSGAGILNIPFIQQYVDARKMDGQFWINNMVKDDNPVEFLQYSQTINLVFPPTGGKELINWPHVTINTMRKCTEAEYLDFFKDTLAASKCPFGHK